MSTLGEVAATLRSILTDVTGFAVPITITDPSGTDYEISGLQADIGMILDPDTGVMVQGRKSTIAVSMQALLDLGLPIPEAAPDEDLKPWLVKWTPSVGPEQTMAVTGAMPDKLGCVVLELSRYAEAE